MRTCEEDRPTERVGDTLRCKNRGPESDPFMLVVYTSKKQQWQSQAHAWVPFACSQWVGIPRLWQARPAFFAHPGVCV